MRLCGQFGEGHILCRTQLSLYVRKLSQSSLTLTCMRLCGQFGGHVLRPPVPTTAGRSNYSYADARWGGGVLAAGESVSAKRRLRLPSSGTKKSNFRY